MAITQLEITKAKPGAKPYSLLDGHGLSLVISTNGSKLWRYKYQFNKRQRLMSLGSYPVVSLADARARHLEARKQVANGIDPMAKPDADVESTSFETVAEAWWEHWKSDKNPIHAGTTRRRLQADVLPALGSRDITKIKAGDVAKMIQQIETRDALDIARRALQTVGQIFRYAVARDICDFNPVASIRPADLLKSRKVQNMARVSASDLPKLMVDIDEYDGQALTKLAQKFLALTVVRTKEMIGATWDEIDLQKSSWVIPRERMKTVRGTQTPHIVPLSRQAVEILRAIRLITGNRKIVFPGEQKAETMSNNTVLFAMYGMGYKGRMTGHGWRGVFSTTMREKGYAREHVETQLAHLSGDAVERAYNHAKYVPQRTEMMQAWADYLDAQLALGRTTA